MFWLTGISLHLGQRPQPATRHHQQAYQNYVRVSELLLAHRPRDLFWIIQYHSCLMRK